MKYPAMLYKVPGPHHGPAGHSYDFKQVRDEESAEPLLAAGWHKTLPDAVASVANPVAATVNPNPDHTKNDDVPASVEAQSDDAPPTRAELEQKARELGIKFDGRTGDATLAKKIGEALR